MRRAVALVCGLVGPSWIPGGPVAWAQDQSVVPLAQSLAAYNFAVWVVTALLAAILILVVIGLGIATYRGWSLGDAVSEESSQQPKVINEKKDVIMVASSSRLIAFLGLMGILTTVLGIGYAVMWHLFIYGTVPDLTQARNFLFGSATLFAPYLANQVREILSPSNPPPPANSGASAPASSGAQISGVDPAAPESGAAAQAIRFTGTGFQKGLSVTLIDPRGTKHTLTANSITSVSPTLVGTTCTLDQTGEWKAAVSNPGEPASDVFRFSAAGKPTITGVNPAKPVNNANAQKLVFIGEGFMDGLSLKLTEVSAAATTALSGSAITSVSPTQIVVNGLLARAGKWEVVISNPGNRDSAPFGFDVS